MVHKPVALKLAVSTLWDGSLRYGCALPLWCRSARNFGKAIHSTLPVVIIKPANSTAQA